MQLQGRGTYSLEGYILFMQQFIAIIFKRYYYIKRNWKGLFSQILLPALFVCVAMTVALTAPQVTDLPPMTISTAQYYNYTQPNGNYIPYSNLNQDIGDASWSKDARGKQLVRTFRWPAGLGATCLLKKPFNSSFDETIMRQINSTHRNYTLLEKYFIPSCRDVFVKGIPLGNFVPPPPTGVPMPMMNDTDVINLGLYSSSIPPSFSICCFPSSSKKG
jgi:ATP-binding cassette subfamily A (ABC1) protein 2